MKRRFLLPALAIMFLTLSRLSCEQECESDYIDLPSHITQTSLSTAPLDNRKEAPVVLGPGAQGFLDAYGFRVSMSAEPVDSLGGSDPFCTNYYLDPGIATCRVFTTSAIPGVSGPDVSHLFRYLHIVNRVPMYLTLPETASQIMLEWESTYQKRYDFVLVEPPAAEGWYQFEFRMTMQDSSILSILTDSVYLR